MKHVAQSGSIDHLFSWFRRTAAVLVAGATGAYAVPTTVQYQGYITDVEDVPITGIIQVIFRLYDDPEPVMAPGPRWQETHDEVTVLDGRFAAQLGSFTPFSDAGVTFDEALFLELEIGGEILAPRIPLHSVPYALRASGVIPLGVTAEMLAPHAVTAGKIHVNLAGEGLALNEGGALRVATAGITAEMLAAGAVADRHIAPDAAIDPSKILGTAVTLDQTQTLTNKTLDADLNAIHNLDLDSLRDGVVVTALGGETADDDTLPTARAVVGYMAGQDSLAEMADTDIGPPVSGQILQLGADGIWRNQAVGGDVHADSGGTFTIQPGAVALGSDTTGMYLAALNAGDGLSGGGTGEGIAVDVAVNVDGTTLIIANDTLAVAPGGITAGLLAEDLDASKRGFKAFEAVLADQVDGADVDDASLAAPDILWSSAKTLDALAAILDARGWQAPVDAFVTTPPATPAMGDRVIANGTPGWNDGSIYTFDGNAWQETPPVGGSTTWVSELAATYIFTEGVWQASSTLLAHNTLAGIQGGNETEAFHLTAALHGALNTLGSSRLTATDADGLPRTTDLGQWLNALPDHIVVDDNGDGTVTLGLPQAVGPTSSPIFAGLTLDGTAITTVSNDGSLEGDSVAALTTEHAVKTYVDAKAGETDRLDELTDTNIAEAVNGSLLQYNGSQWVPISLVPGENVDLKGGGGLTHGSGLMLDLAEDGTLVIVNNKVGVGVVDRTNVAPDAVLLGVQTEGDYVAGITAGEGLVGTATGEASDAVLSVNVDGTTLVIVSDKVGVGVVDRTNIAPDAVLLGVQTEGDYVAGITAGEGLAGTAAGEASDAVLSVNVDGTTIGIKADELRLVDGGVSSRHLAMGAVGVDQLADGVDASTKGFIATTALDADRVDGADVDDAGGPSPVVLWSSARVTDYVDGLINGLEWARSVDHFAATIPPDPTPGLRVIARGTPEWDDDSIYEFDGEAWSSSVPVEGEAVWVIQEDRNYVYNGTEWVTFGSTQSHDALSGLQGGSPGEYFHMPQSMFEALRTLSPGRLLAADEAGLPESTAASAWMVGTSHQVAVTDAGDGSVVLSLPQDIDPTAEPEFAGLVVADNLTLAGDSIIGFSTDGTLGPNSDQLLPTQQAVRTYVDGVAATADSLAELNDTDLAGLAAGDLLQFDGSAWTPLSMVPGERVELKDGGGITHGSGLMLDLLPDGTLQLQGNALHVGVIGTDNIADDAIILGTQTTGRYVAAVFAGVGLSGDADSEGGIAHLDVVVDTESIVIDAAGALAIGFVPVDRVGDAGTGVELVDTGSGSANGASLIGIDATAVDHVTANTVQGALAELGLAVTQAGPPQLLYETVVATDHTGSPIAALQADSTTDVLTVNAGAGLELAADASADVLSIGVSVGPGLQVDGGTNALGILPDGVTLRIGAGGVLEVNEAAIDAGSVDGADVDDMGGPAADVLWSSAKTKDFIEGLLNGLDWQASIKGMTGSMPATPGLGDRYIAVAPLDPGTTWTVDWLYEFNGVDWTPIEPTEGFAVWVEDEDRNYVYNGSAWVTFGSTQNHEALAGLQGGLPNEHYHLTQALHDTLNALPTGRVLATDDAGLLTAAEMADWVRGTPGALSVTPNPDGGVTLDLTRSVPVATATQDAILMGVGSSWSAVAQTRISRLGTIVEGTWEGSPIDGAFIDLAPDGAITHGSGLMIDLADDGTLAIAGNKLGVGVIQADNVGPDTVALGSKTTGDYLAGLTAGEGLHGGGAGEGSTVGLDVNVDGTTIHIVSDALAIAPQGIAATHLAPGIDASGIGFMAATATDADRVDGADVDDLAGPAPDILWSSAKTHDMLTGLFSGLTWQPSVIAIVSDLPVEPGSGDRYIILRVPAKGTLVFPHSIYEFDGTDWQRTVPVEGCIAWVEAEDAFYVFDGSTWAAFGPGKDHNSFSGLQGGDSDEYYHLDAALFASLTGLSADRLVATDSAGLPIEADLAGWVGGTTGEIVVIPGALGGISLGLDSTVARGLPTAGHLLVGDGSAWLSVDQTAITRLGIVSAGTWNGDVIDGDYISLAPDGGIVHGSGLKLNLDPTDLALIVDANNIVRVNEITGFHVVDGTLSGDDIGDGTLTGADLAPQTLASTHLLGIVDPGDMGQPVLSDGEGSFLLGGPFPMVLAEGTPEWRFVREVNDVMAAPTGMTRDDRGNLYAADPDNHCVWLYAAAGTLLGWFGLDAEGVAGFHPASDPFAAFPGVEAGAFDSPRDVAFQMVQSLPYTPKTLAEGRYLWIADTGNNRLQRIDLDNLLIPATVYESASIDAGLVAPSGIAALGDLIVVSDTGQDRVLQFSHDGFLYLEGWYGSDGTSGGFYSGGGMQPGSGALMFRAPMEVDLMVDTLSGVTVLAVADSGNARACFIHIDTQSMLGWIGGGSDGSTGWHAAGAPETPIPGTGPGAFAQPDGVAINSHYIAVSDAGSDVTQIFSNPLTTPVKALPTYLTTLGETGSDTGQFSMPSGVRFDRDGGLWVCDTGNSRLQKFTAPHPENYAVVPPENGNVIVGGDVPLSSAALQIDSIDSGLLIPRLTTDQMVGITDPAEGLLVFNLGTPYALPRDKTLTLPQGFYFWNGNDWERVGELKPGDVESVHIAPGAVDSWHLMTDAVTGSKIADDTIPDSKLQTITTADKVAGSAVQLEPAGGLLASSSGLAVDVDMFVQHCPTDIYVCAGESVQSAIDRITDAGADKPYVIHVGPGVFNEKIILKSHVDIIGSGIGKTVLLSNGGTAPVPTKSGASSATVTAIDVVNAGMRHLTIVSARNDGAGELVGLYYDGVPAGRGLQLLHTKIVVYSGPLGIEGDAWGILGPYEEVSGLVLDHVDIDANVTTPIVTDVTGPTSDKASGSVVGIELMGTLAANDCTVKVGTQGASGYPTGIALGLVNNTSTLKRCTITTGVNGWGVDAWGTGLLELDDCEITTTGDYSTGLAASGLYALVRARETTIAHIASEEGSPVDVAKLGIYDGSIELVHCDLLGPGDPVAVSSSGFLIAYYSRIAAPSVGYKGTLPLQTAFFFRCVQLDESGFPTNELHTWTGK